MHFSYAHDKFYVPSIMAMFTVLYNKDFLQIEANVEINNTV